MRRYALVQPVKMNAIAVTPNELVNIRLVLPEAVASYRVLLRPELRAPSRSQDFQVRSVLADLNSTMLDLFVQLLPRPQGPLDSFGKPGDTMFFQTKLNQDLR